MGVDSGLPDFRGDRGFWKAYPPFERLGVSFVDMANPTWFVRDPELAWGFYGHRLQLYRDTAPHRGFSILDRWAENLAHRCFVFTSNVDGHFQRAGFKRERVIECHGSIAHLQCTEPCCNEIWSGSEFVPRLILPLSLSYDHRVIDGADAVRFTTRLKTVLSDIRNLLL